MFTKEFQCLCVQAQIHSQKVNMSHVTSKCGSKDNMAHKPGAPNRTSPIDERSSFYALLLSSLHGESALQI